ncbi:hypothetical protein [Pseudoroseicyclus aestuarii]|uniref:Flagellar assembly protein FliH n=1 Tax=Pseudoroseicyclus aestuarii TaxID=1795041 RepID=A0A318SW59_9RHOB|nr:hypothetical protein [Pseudoroseicyclus aestuarii]PYE84596.1 hypothetical protein DFP88_102397 [Pseudoroseicyclus aestuarii]
MAIAEWLECFDDSPEPLARVDPEGPGEDWLEGHAAGVEAGRAAAAAEQAALTERLVQTLDDMGFGYAEARAHLLAALRPLFAALSESLVPGLAAQGLALRLAERLAEAAEADAGLPVTLRVAPTETEAFEQVASSAPLPLRLQPDPVLEPGQLVLERGGSATMLDALSLVEELRGALDALAAGTSGAPGEEAGPSGAAQPGGAVPEAEATPGAAFSAEDPLAQHRAERSERHG